MYIIAGLLNILHSHFGNKDVNIESIFNHFETDIANLTNPLEKIEVDVLGHYLEEIVANSGNHRIGLEAGFKIPFTLPTINFNLYKDCKTVGDLFVKLEELESTTNDFTYHNTRIENGLFYYEVEVHPVFAKRYPNAARIWTEMQYGMALQYAYSYTGRYHYPIEAHSRYAKEYTPDKLEEYLNCRVYFSRPTTCLVFKKTVLDLPVVAPNKEVIQLFQDTMEEIKHNQNRQSISQKTRRYMTHNLETITLRSVATKFNMSERTFQRKLQQEGHTFQQILDQLRRDLANKYLSERVPLREIAYLLGFESQSAFNKFYKKHFGKRPRD